MYISSVSSESIDNITNDIIKTNIKNLIKKIDDKDEKNLINWEIAKNVAITIENKYNTELPEITYNNTKREDYAPSDQKNIIIYAGDFHSKLYRDFILFSKISTININSQLGQYGHEDNCLDMTGIHQPFFSL